jgi:integrase
VTSELQFSANAGDRISPLEIWVFTPRPSPVVVWTPAQTMVFLDAAGRHRLHALWRLIATRGLRRGEGCGLRRPDTDLAGGTTAVRWQITQLATRFRPSQGRRSVDCHFIKGYIKANYMHKRLSRVNPRDGGRLARGSSQRIPRLRR